MRKLLIVFALTFTFQSNAQKHMDSIPSIDLTVISRVNQGNSYITFPTDIGNIEPLWFEGNIIPNFYIRKNKTSRLMGVLTPQIIIRMFQEESSPVKTPSYMPQITVYYNFKKKNNSPDFSMYGRIAHHSNGQDGDFLLENGEINLKNGDFSTNFLELGLITTTNNVRFNAYQFFKTSIEIHPDAFINDELEGIYSQYRWHNAFSIFKLPQNENQVHSKKPAISIKGEAIWMFGNYNNFNAKSLSPERLNLSLIFYYHPTFLEDIGLFVQYYHGSDYYNIYFDHRMDILRFGFMTETLRF